MILKFKEIVENKDIIGEYKSRELVKLYCDHCDNVFTRMKNAIQTNIRRNIKNSFCSKKCQSLNQITKTEVRCNNCEKSIMKLASDIKKNIPLFCDQSCSASYNNRSRFKSEEYRRKIRENMKEKYRNGEINHLKNLYGEFHYSFGNLTSKSTVSELPLKF